MTTRQQLRRAVTGDRGDAGRGISAEPAPTLPERLYDARERKGVDLYRAERDTKIRARYLGALERGDYRELPGAVYTKGFLRNYALYLGLDPDEVLDQWRRERGDSKEVTPVLAVPRPMAAPRQGLTFSPSLVVFALLTLGVLAFGAYLGVQLLRFAKPPTIAVTNPAAAVVEVDEGATDYTMRGTSTAGATISIATPGRDPYNVTGRRLRSVAGRGRAPPRPERIPGEFARSRHRQALRRDAGAVHHRAVPRDRGTYADGGPADRGGDVRERRDPGAGSYDECRNPSW